MKGLDDLQDALNGLPPDEPTCRNAWCGWWERNDGAYEKHTPADHPDLFGDVDEPVPDDPQHCFNCGNDLPCGTHSDGAES